jgi:hypothetical protein
MSNRPPLPLWVGLGFRVRDHDYGNTNSPQNTSKVHPIEIQKSFMHTGHACEE